MTFYVVEDFVEGIVGVSCFRSHRIVRIQFMYSCRVFKYWKNIASAVASVLESVVELLQMFFSDYTGS